MDVKHIDLNTIKPESKGDGEFFSWQLYKWVRKFPQYTRVYLAPWNNVEGFNTDKPTLMIGFRFDDGWVHGAPLRSICLHGAALHSFAYGPNFKSTEWRDITEQFWEDYFRIGRCAIHGDLDHNWEYTDSNTRVCTRCKTVENQEMEMRPHYSWVGSEPAAAV